MTQTMQNKERPLAALLFFSASISLFGTVVPSALAEETVPLSDLRACATLSSASAKLACFEGLIPAEQPISQSKQMPAKPTPKPMIVKETAEPKSMPEPAKVAARQENMAVRELSDDDGSEHLKGNVREDRDETIVATITSVEAKPRKALVFYFENGQVWRQTKAGYWYYPKSGPFQVHIKQGMMGDFQMRVNGEGRMTRIERIE